MKSAFRRTATRVALAAGVAGTALVLCSQPSSKEHTGPLSGGGFLLHNGWKLQPAGRQVVLGDFPMAAAPSPDGKYLLVLNAGGHPTLSVLETASASLTSSAPIPDGWLGLTLNPQGDRVYVGAGSQGSVLEFAFSHGMLHAERAFPVTPDAPVSGRDFIGDVAFSPDGRLLYAANLYRNSVAVINPQSGRVIQQIKTGRRPYRILFHPDGKSFFVSHWADGTVGQYDTFDGSLLSAVRVGPHPTDLLWREGNPAEPSAEEPRWTARLFVAAAHTNTVYTIGVSASKNLTLLESISVAMTPRQPLGMTPSALALSPDKKRLYVVCSDANTVAVVDVTLERSRVEGFLPVGRYPTAIQALPSGALVVLNGKGFGAGGVQAGTASWIEPFQPWELEAWTNVQLANSPYRDSQLDEPSPLPPPIRNVLYIVREGGTYDEVFGDIQQGNGQFSLARLGESVTPNAHKLAREFLLLDNFYVNGDSVADGQYWSTAAIAPDYVAKLRPGPHMERRGFYRSEEQDPVSFPPAGYLWTNAARAGISMRNFGFLVDNKPVTASPETEQIAGVRDPILAKVTNRFYRGADSGYADVSRAKAFLAELAQYETRGEMPRLMVMRLANGPKPESGAGPRDPSAAAADNDSALGQIVEAVSKSKFWRGTLICVVQADSGNGQDHVDPHRVPALLISPYIRRHTVDSTLYTTASMLRTVEFVLGLHPMTQFDAGARPITAAFQNTPNPAPYTAEKPRLQFEPAMADGEVPNLSGK
jgi:YVTN family beta-propeller protein